MCADSIGLFMHTITSSADRDVFFSFIPIWMLVVVVFFFFNLRKHKQERGRERGTEDLKGLCADSSEPYVGLELMHYEIMT